MEKIKKNKALIVAIFIVVTIIVVGFILLYKQENLPVEQVNTGPQFIMTDTILYEIPDLDLRGYPFDHSQVERWFLERVNYHRENYGLHPYVIYIPATLTSIDHSIDMRDNEFLENEASDGRTHRQRHDTWFGVERTKVTSTLVFGFTLEGPMDEEIAAIIVDRMMENGGIHSFLLNPTYYYLGIGVSLCEDGNGYICMTMASRAGERAAHRARTAEEIEIHRQEYLERVRTERGWTPPESME